jgi:prepilin peptidase CpaA
MQFTLPPPGMAVMLITLVGIAAIYDIRYRRIPNWLTLAGLITGIALNTFLAWDTPNRWSGLTFSLLGAGLAFILNFILFALRARGGGDVKLMTAIGAMVGWENWVGVFIVSAVFGGIAAILMSIAHKRLGKTLWNVGFIMSEMKEGRPAYLGREELDVKSSKAFRLPAGAVIAVGCFFFLALSWHFAA